ncbi:MAG: type II toxin-antitoxin system VapC family toxin [Pseudonocardiaceae bacterium]
MILCDVNVLVFAHKEGADRHNEYRSWLEEVMNGDEAFGVSDFVLSSVLRIVTHPRVFDPPSPWDRAREFAEAVRSAPSAVPIAPGPRHWQIFTELGEKAGVRGNLVSDAYLAALAIESGSEWITTDRGFARYPGLRFRHPLEPT